MSDAPARSKVSGQDAVIQAIEHLSDELRETSLDIHAHPASEPFYRGIMGMGVGYWDLARIPAGAP